MNEQITKYIEPIINFWKNLEVKKKKILIGALSGVVIVAVVLTFLMGTTRYTVLYSGMDDNEAIAVMQVLQEKGVDCKLEDGGVVLVPKDQEDELRMQLAIEGYPKSATNYDIFIDNIDLMTTDYEKRELKIYQLNERIKATVETIDIIDTAIVTISIPEDDGYAWEDNPDKPTASVMIETIGGVEPTSSQVNGIKQLVAKSVPGLETSEVAVVDSTGNELQSSEDMTQMSLTEFGLVIKAKFEEDIQNKVSNVLAPIFGDDNFTISVSGIVNLDTKIQEIITYTPSDEENNQGILQEGSKDTEIITNGSDDGGVAGTEENIDLTTYAGVTVNGDEIYINDSETYSYLVNQVIEQVSHDSAVLEELYVAVSLNKAELDLTDRDDLVQLVATAAATESDNVFIYNKEFSVAADTDDQPGDTVVSIWENELLLYGAIGLGGLLLLIMIIGLLMIKRKKRTKAVPEPEIDARELLDLAGEEFDSQYEMEEKLSAIAKSKYQKMIEKIQDFSHTNPEIAAQLIRSLLREEGDLND